MSFFDSFREEAKQRDKENYAAKVHIEKEKERIRKNREKSREKRNIIRKKVKIVDKLVSDREDKKDQKELEAIQLEQAEKIKKARIARSEKSGHQNRNKVMVLLTVCLVLISGGIAAGYNVHNSNLEKEYESAVGLILEENYSAALDKLDGLTINDSKSLTSYSRCQLNVKSYKGDSDKFITDLKKSGSIDNVDIKNQKQTAIEQAEIAKSVQEEINAINTDTINGDTEKELETIDKHYSDISNRYKPLVDMSRYDKVQLAVKHIKNNTNVGKVIVAINSLGKIGLESKDSIKRTRALYDNLSESEKKEVINIGTLKKAEEKYASLKEAEEERIAEEKRAEEEAQREKEEKAKKLEYTVYTVYGSDVYHCSEGCYHLRGTNYYPLSQRKAIANNKRPCDDCADTFILP